MVWFHGATELKDPNGKNRIVGHYSRLKSLGHLLEHGIAAFNDRTGNMDIVATFPIEAPLHPFGQTLRHTENGSDYVYFCTPYPISRVRATWDAFKDPSQYEAYTPLKTGTRSDKGSAPSIERDENHRPDYKWRPATTQADAPTQERWIRTGAMKRAEALIRTVDSDTGKPITLVTGSVRWNAFRKKWIMIACRRGAEASFLGEIYYAESESLIGPWPRAVKVATHPNYTFYNPVHHAFLDKEGGRLIYFEGTYTRQFSKTKTPTPRYDYNQNLYKLDLADPRLEKLRP